MKTLVFTGFDKGYWPLAQRTVPLMDHWAQRHGYEFKAYHEPPPVDIPNAIYWTGVIGTLDALEKGYNRVMYLDVDQMITNLEWEIPNDWSGFHVSKDWGEDAIEPWHFSACGFIAHKDVESIFKYIWSLEPEWREKPFPEQGPMRYVFQGRLEAMNAIGSIDSSFFLYPRRTLNAVPDEVCPSKVPEPWQSGDFACHLTMLPLEERVKLFDEMILRL